MRIPFLSMFMSSPFAGLQDHADKVKECMVVFQQAMENRFTGNTSDFDELRQEIIKIESDADTIKSRIRSRIPNEAMVHVNKFQLFRYLKEQDRILDRVEDALDWISFRDDSAIPKEFAKDFFLLVDVVVEQTEEMALMVAQARKYVNNFSGKQRKKVHEIIKNVQTQEKEANKAEKLIKSKAFSLEMDPVSVFHVIRLAEVIGAIADHVEEAGDIMLSMLSAP